MDQTEFHERLEELLTGMVGLAFEYVGENKAEVDDVYVYVSMEKGIFFYNAFYRINGKLVEMHLVNTVSEKQYDLSDDRTYELLDMGIEDAQRTAELFKDAGREVPTEMKMVYSPKTGSFNNDIGYELKFTHDPVKTTQKVFEEWFVGLGGKLS